MTEIRPGTYVFNDNMQVVQGVAVPDHLAVTALTTVISRASDERCTVDAGSKVFSGDVYPPSLNLRGYGEGFGGPDCYVERMNEEHGVVHFMAGSAPPIGAKLRLVPNHVCTSVSLSDELVGIRNGRVECVWQVAARGKRE